MVFCHSLIFSGATLKGTAAALEIAMPTISMNVCLFKSNLDNLNILTKDVNSGEFNFSIRE